MSCYQGPRVFQVVRCVYGINSAVLPLIGNSLPRHYLEFLPISAVLPHCFLHFLHPRGYYRDILGIVAVAVTVSSTSHDETTIAK